ncbi:hypothetical protein BSLG_005080 [Batrachochytrium salamandrivorans]|nr:hypothetical protein BSLG_005080 [Batrachochytrium salamandrivorans]
MDLEQDRRLEEQSCEEKQHGHGQDNSEELPKMKERARQHIQSVSMEDVIESEASKAMATPYTNSPTVGGGEQAVCPVGEYPDATAEHSNRDGQGDIDHHATDPNSGAATHGDGGDDSADLDMDRVNGMHDSAASAGTLAQSSLPKRKLDFPHQSGSGRSSPLSNDPMNMLTDAPEISVSQAPVLLLIPKEQLTQDQIDRNCQGPCFCRPLLGLNAMRPAVAQPAAPNTFGLDIKILSGLSRIYIGSIPFDILEEHMRLAFVQFGCIKSVSMTLDPATNRHKGFCFVEFEAPEALMAIERMHGLDMGGRALRVGRPSNFANYDLSTLPQPMPLNTRLYISNVSELVSEDDIIALFETFGKVEACSLIPNMLNRQHKTFGYVQYASSDSVNVAVTTMNNFELGGRTLCVCRSIFGTDMPAGMRSMPKTGPTPIHSMVPNAANGANNTEAGSSLVSQDMLARLRYTMGASTGASVGIPTTNHGDDLASLEEPQSITASQRYMIMQKLQRPDEDGAAAPSTVLLLCNMVVYDDIDEFLKDEIKQECEKYGFVKQVVLLQEEGKTHNPDDMVKVYVEFGTVDVSIKARLALDGRFFGGRQIKANYSQIPQLA